MLSSFINSEYLQEEKTSQGKKLIAAALALLLTGGVLAGYLYFRNRHAKNVVASEPGKSTSAGVPKGPPKAHILVDQALLNGGQTTIAGSVKNISQETLSELAVELELKRRDDGTTERKNATLNPASLEPNQEGRYSLKLPAEDFSSVRLVALKGGPDSAAIFYTTGQGQKRPLERLQPKVVIVPRRPSKGGEFLNSPENPARVP